MLSHGTRLTIGLLLDDLRSGYQSSYQIALTRGMADLAQERNVNLLCFVGDSLHLRSEAAIQRNKVYDLVSEENVDGLVILAGAVGSRHALEMAEFCQRFVPMPMISVALRIEGIPSLLVDNYQGMRQAVEHLVDTHDRSQIAFFRKHNDHPEGDERYRAYVDVLNERGLAYDNNLVVDSEYYDNPKGGINLLLDKRRVEFDAIVAVDDHTALAVLEELHARGIQVPDEIAVVGFDDIEDDKYSMPPLTTVQQPLYEQGQLATQMLLDLINGEDVSECVELPAQLVVRQSCGCPSHAMLQAGTETAVIINSSLQVDYPTWQEQTFAEMKAVMETSLLDRHSPQWTEDLLKAFSDALQNGSRDIFLTPFHDILRAAIAEDGNVHLWHEVLSILRRCSLPYLVDNIKRLLHAENLFQQARVIIGEIAQRVQTGQEQHAKRQAVTLSEIGEKLLVVEDIQGLVDVLIVALPQLGVPDCFISLYQYNSSNELSEQPELPGLSKLILKHTSEQESETGRVDQFFLTQRLVPQGIKKRQKRCSMVIEPLYLGNDQLGFALFEMDLREVVIYEALRGQISSAVKNVRLIEEVQQGKAYLQSLFLL